MRFVRRTGRAVVLAVTGPFVALAGILALLTAGLFAPRPVVEALSDWQRRRYSVLAGEPLVAPVERHGVLRQQLFHWLAVPMSIVTFAATVGSWALSAAGFGWLSFGWSLRADPDGLLRYGSPVPMSVVPILSSLLLIVGFFAALRFTDLELAVARTLLQASRAERLSARVDRLTESRAETVDAADAERRRIERDLHDGAQQRLVSLAMNLGLARATLTEADPQAREALAAAHDEAKLALSELRDLVRGLHPAVLDDRGLDAALSGIAARSPVPVELTVELPADAADRPSRTIEAVAYFVVAEALSNVAKHAGATAVTVDVRHRGDRLRLWISDNGRGGADPARGTGLRGLAQRAGSVDGRLTVTSPIGGPTVIEVELPCE
ncbi:sensor histidine kinase [Hamadaea tsunoensis]|uniref:sensor histidine kinase n=1 Tax=Hamadaea tsunoensis TaxID=53368 RepID=UPI000A0089B4|nr:sensor histidine kinase [Hamadaea tsunoensis]